MIEPIIGLLIDLGILRADFRHYNRVKNKELEDGKSRFFSKYFLQPSVLGALVFVGLSLIVGVFIVSGSDDRKASHTMKEMIEIKENLEEWRTGYGFYPTELEEVVRARPLRREWLRDEWGQLYDYKISTGGEGVSLTASGPYHVFSTADDLK